jgi:hypothetical protein
MRVLKFETFGGWSIDKELVKFVNDKNIKQEDIIKIVYKSHGGVYTVFYFAEE